jgi:Raf kinase inhibitor-like YbhB/YbcL family protein
MNRRRRSTRLLFVVAAVMLRQAGCAPDRDAGKEKAMARKNVHGYPVSLASDLLGASATGKIEVRSSAFENGSPIPAQYADYGGKVSPPLSWSGVPGDAKSLVLMCEDPDPPVDPRPFIHWLLYNLPPGVSELPGNVATTPTVDRLGDARQGRNSRGSAGYFGPRPPKPDPAHHYHFQVYAMDRELSLPPGADRQALLDAMKGHVLAFGELVGTFQAPRGGA